MNGDKYLLDTNILLYLMGKKITAKNLPEGDFYISFITELETLSYPSLSDDEETKLKKFFSEIPIIDINADIKKQTIDFRRKYSLKLPDAIIASTAYILKANLITNDKGFSIVKELKVKSIKL